MPSGSTIAASALKASKRSETIERHYIGIAPTLFRVGRGAGKGRTDFTIWQAGKNLLDDGIALSRWKTDFQFDFGLFVHWQGPNDVGFRAGQHGFAG